MDLPLDASAPFELADGTKIDPTTGSIVKERKAFIEVPAPSVAQQLVVRARKSIADLPVPPQQLSGVALVAFYTLFGLSDSDIALALDGRLTVEQIERIRALDVYRDFMESAKTNIIDTSADQVREVFQNNALRMANNIINAANGDDDNVLAFKASQDVLDRAGHRPADIIEHKHKLEGGLNIVITRRDATQEAPVIDIDFERLDQDAYIQ